MIAGILFFLILIFGVWIFYKPKKYEKNEIIAKTENSVIEPILSTVFGETEFYDGDSYGLWVDDVLVGCVCKATINENGVNGPYIYNLAVLPIYRNRGYGTLLLNHVKEPGVWLMCEKGNLDWYLGHSFQIVNTFQNEFILRL